MQSRIDQLFAQGVDAGHVMGVAGVVVNQQEVLYDGAAGLTQAGGSPMSTDTVAAIMSMTKALTGAAAMQLVEQGRLELDAPAGEVCPYLDRVQVYAGTDDEGNVRLRPPIRPVTLRNLLTHSSGFVYDIWNQEFADLLERMEIPSIGSLQLRALEVPLMFDPGSRWEYGIGIDWVGQMVEAVTGQRLGEYFKEHLTGPLGMGDTAFQPTPEMLPRIAPIHHRQNDGSLLLPQLTSDDVTGPPAEFEMGGGGLLSTTRDYAKFLQMLLGGGELDGQRVLKPTTVELMFRNHLGDLAVTGLRTAAPSMSLDAEFFPGEPKAIAICNITDFPERDLRNKHE